MNIDLSGSLTSKIKLEMLVESILNTPTYTKEGVRLHDAYPMLVRSILNNHN